jgi:hypothetical protein
MVITRRYPKWNELQYSGLFFKGKVVVICKTESSANIFIKFILKNDVSWIDGDAPVTEDTNYELYEENTYYQYINDYWSERWGLYVGNFDEECEDILESDAIVVEF